MSLLPHVPRYGHFFDDVARDMDRFERSMLAPYWSRGNDSLNFGNTACDVINNDNKFGVELDVSQFRPHELKVHVDGHLLTIEGHHELHDRGSFMERSFVRKWTLPEDVDLSGIHSSLTNEGHLCIDAPKSGAPAQRFIPIDRM